MKTRLLVGAAVLLLFAASCKKDAPVAEKTDGEETFIPTDPDLNLVDVAYPQSLTTGQFRTIAGTAGQRGSVDGNGANARFASPHGIFVKTDGSLLVADVEGEIRHLKHDTVVSSIHFPVNADGFTYFDGRDVAATKDGTIGVQGERAFWLYRPDGTLLYRGADLHDQFGGIALDPTGKFFWRTVFRGIAANNPNGDFTQNVPQPADVDGQYGFDAISAANNGVKYFSTSRRVYKLTKSGVTAQIFTAFNFTEISSIRATRDGFKVYIVDKGDIKVIANNSKYPQTIRTLLSGQQAVCIALSNSEKFLYFTTLQNTVVKLAL